MTPCGYGNVPEKAFLAFRRDLSEGAWRDISLEGDEYLGQGLASPLLHASPPGWKLRVTIAIASLRDTLGARSAILDRLDADWISIQRKLHAQLSSARQDRAEAKREAAERLRGALLLGDGTAQTILGWDEEVDFGRRQVALTQEGPLAGDARMVGLAFLLKAVEDTTEALARGLGRGPGQKRSSVRAARMRESRAACAAVFRGIHGEIAWLLDHTDHGATRARLSLLLAPFQALLDRYPPESSAAPADPASAPPPAMSLA
jgi:hypothetical protein